MKIQYFFSLMIVAGLMMTTSCKNEQSNTITEESTVTTAAADAPILIKDSTKVAWTAYKTTEKVPVKGDFTKFHFDKMGEGSTVAEVLNNARFNIDAFSLLTGDKERDATIRNNFFRMMNPAGSISGEFLHEGDNWFANLEMNGVTFKVPLEMKIDGKRADVSAVIDLNDFGVGRALEALNKACGDLHKGADGVSKTWEDVAVTGSVQFQ